VFVCSFVCSFVRSFVRLFIHDLAILGMVVDTLLPVDKECVHIELDKKKPRTWSHVFKDSEVGRVNSTTVRDYEKVAERIRTQREAAGGSSTTTSSGDQGAAAGAAPTWHQLRCTLKHGVTSGRVQPKQALSVSFELSVGGDTLPTDVDYVAIFQFDEQDASNHEDVEFTDGRRSGRVTIRAPHLPGRYKLAYILKQELRDPVFVPGFAAFEVVEEGPSGSSRGASGSSAGAGVGVGAGARSSAAPQESLPLKEVEVKLLSERCVTGTVRACWRGTHHLTLLLDWCDSYSNISCYQVMLQPPKGSKVVGSVAPQVRLVGPSAVEVVFEAASPSCRYKCRGKFVCDEEVELKKGSASVRVCARARAPVCFCTVGLSVCPRSLSCPVCLPCRRIMCRSGFPSCTLVPWPAQSRSAS